MDTEKKDPRKLVDDAIPPEKAAPKLTDDAISSKRALTRRSLLATLGIGAGVATVAVFGATTPAWADRAKVQRYRDRDVSDGARVREFRDGDPLSDRIRVRRYRDQDPYDRIVVNRFRDND
jgi:hypothetical protein